MKRVLVFGSFDPLHEGHVNFFEQAKKLGDHLTVVVAHDAALRVSKKREPFQKAEERLQAVAQAAPVSRAMIGSAQANQYDLLSDLDFEIIALGYDQEPSLTKVRQELARRGKREVAVVRLKPYQPEKYKSTLIRYFHSRRARS